ncbi:Fc.00g009490.m01.CDS01 [Cosmosporella sp. VM-42]
MAPEVIDLISSSPPPSPRSLGAPRAIDKGKAVQRRTRRLDDHDGIPGLQSPTTLKSSAIPARIAPLASNDFSFLSDDFDTTFDADEPILTDTTGNKRRRLSPPEKDSVRPFKRSISGPTTQSIRPSVRTSGNGYRTSTFDPIEFSSSLDPSSGNTRHTRKNGDSSRNRQSTDLDLEDDSDPFDSFPRIARAPANKSSATTKPPQSSDPFASSPRIAPRPADKPSVTTRPEEPSDPFASSPPLVDLTKSRQDTRPVHTGSSRHTILDRRKPSPKLNQNWDPISSSAPENCSFRSSPPTQSRPVVIDIGDSDSEAESDGFPDIANFDITKCKRQSFRRTQSETIPKSRSKSSKAAAPKKSAEEKTREKEARAVAREADKESKRREKQEAKEAKTREKERNAALAEVNKLRTDKKVSTPEMIVDVPSSLNATTTTQLEALLEGLDVQFTTWESPVENVIKWRRKVRSRFNDDLGLWEPISLRLEPEKHVLVILTADEFVNLAVADDLESHITKMEHNFSNHHIIYLLEGLIPWMRKNRNIRNRQFTSGVRSQEPSTQARRRKNATEGYVPEETIEDALLQLQVMHDVLIHHTTIPLETAQWITIFTQHVSTIPYKKQKDQATLGAGFCMESGQVRTGDDAKDTYVRMLQEIVRVTAPIAYGIAAEFDNVTDLVHGLERGGPATLEAVRKSANKDGAFSDRTVGQAVSRRMHKVFTGRDDTSTDV